LPHGNEKLARNLQAVVLPAQLTSVTFDASLRERLMITAKELLLQPRESPVVGQFEIQLTAAGAEDTEIAQR